MAQGFFAGGNGTKESPFLIEDADDLNAIRMYTTGKFFKLINDINLSNGKYNIGQGWNPIPNFVGVLDGNNHKINNLYIDRPTTDFVGFFRTCSGVVENLIFVDPVVKGHNCVGILAGIYYNFYGYSDTFSEYGPTIYDKTPLNSYKQYITRDSFKSIIYNVNVLNGKIVANMSGAGLIGIYRFVGYDGDNNSTGATTNRSKILNCMIDVEIQAKDGIATGVVNCNSNLLNSFLASLNLSRNNNCNCNCGTNNPNCWRIYFDESRGIYSEYDGRGGGLGYVGEYRQNATLQSVWVERCVVNLRKNETITTYYGFSNAINNWSQYNVINSKEYNIYATNNDVRIINNLEYDINLLPNIDKENFNVQPNHKIEPIFLNNDAIYLQFNNGYYVYDFTNNEFVQKYTKFSNENSKEIIQNGMDKVSFSKIPNSKLKEIQDKYGKVKVVNCINAHKKIVYKTSVLEMNYDKQKSVYRKKVEFNKFNEVTSIKKK